MIQTSKELEHCDSSAFAFVKEMLDGKPNYAINFDRLMYCESLNRFLLFEFQKCEEDQPSATPYSSSPNRYWNFCWKKYQMEWRVVKKLDAWWYVINYAEAGTKYENEVRLLKVRSAGADGLTYQSKELTRAEFKEWFLSWNDMCARNKMKWEDIDKVS